jgi:predicted DNA-binding transcriptional regulator YafY
MTTVATRLITLILSLQRQPGQKAADLAEKLGVSVRTLHRYFEMLDEMGVPVYAERGPYGGFSLVRGYKLPPLVFTPQEAVAIALGTSLVHEMWGTLYHEEAQGALTKLDNILPDEQRQEIAWARRALIATGMNRADIQILAPSLEKLRRAVRENRRLSMTYHSGTSPHGEQRELDPYALVHAIGWWYVVGYCHLRKALRTFRVDRVAALTLTDQNFSIPADFNIRAYLAQDWMEVPAAQSDRCVSHRILPTWPSTDAATGNRLAKSSQTAQCWSHSARQMFTQRRQTSWRMARQSKRWNRPKCGKWSKNGRRRRRNYMKISLPQR